MYIFINEEQAYTYNPTAKPVWKLDYLKYGDWTSKGTHIKFIEFPISEVWVTKKSNLERFPSFILECTK